MAVPVPVFGLLDQLRVALPEVLESLVLPALDPTTKALLAKTGRVWRATASSLGPPLEGPAQKVHLNSKLFCGSIEFLAWARENGCPWDYFMCTFFVEEGRLDILKWARQQYWPAPWDEGTCAAAAKNGHLGILQWAREHNCPWDWKTCVYATQGGFLDVLRWAREHGCKAGTQTCAYAAQSGNLEFVCECAAQSGHLDLLRWAIQHGAVVWCPHKLARWNLLVGET